MGKYNIKFSFGENDTITQTVESESDDLEVILFENVGRDQHSFTDSHGNFYSFNMSNVKYIKVYPYVRARAYPNKPKGL